MAYEGANGAWIPSALRSFAKKGGKMRDATGIYLFSRLASNPSRPNFPLRNLQTEDAGFVETLHD